MKIFLVLLSYLLMVLIWFVESFNSIYALNTWQTGYQFTQSKIGNITLADGSCKKVTNDGTNRFIPTKTMAEWLSFSSVASFLGINIWNCGTDCTYDTYEWSACSSACGTGQRRVYYTIITPASGGGTCPVTEWQSAWWIGSACTNSCTCSDGVQNQWETYVDCWWPNCLACLMVACWSASTYWQYSPPSSSELCINGTGGPVSDYLNGSYWEYRWTCSGIGGPVNCRWARNIDGVCGSAHHTPTGAQPTSGLCAVWTPSTVVYGAHPYYSQYFWWCHANGGWWGPWLNPPWNFGHWYTANCFTD